MPASSQRHSVISLAPRACRKSPAMRACRVKAFTRLSGERAPGFDTILKVMNALGLKLHAEAVHH